MKTELDTVWWGYLNPQDDPQALTWEDLQTWRIAVDKAFGQRVSIEWTLTGCIVAGVMEFLYEKPLDSKVQ